MTDNPEHLSDQIDFHLHGPGPSSDAAPVDPLLQLARALHETLQPVPPAPEFRARLKAELLERYADNVRPFPTGAVGAPAPVVAHSRLKRARHAVVAVAMATAAAVALLLGYNA